MMKSNYRKFKLPTRTQFSGLPNENFEDWKMTRKLNISLHAVDQFEDMDWAASQTTEITEIMMANRDGDEINEADAVKTRGAALYAVVYQYLGGTAKVLLKHVPKLNGFEAWRSVYTRYSKSANQIVLTSIVQLTTQTKNLKKTLKPR